MALTREQIRARKAEMKKAGISYSGIDDNSWGPWQEKKYQEYLRSKVNPNMPNESRLTYGYAMPLGNPAGSLAKIGSAIVAAAPIIADPKGAGEALSGAIDYVKDIFNWGPSNSRESGTTNGFVPLTASDVEEINVMNGKRLDRLRGWAAGKIAPKKPTESTDSSNSSTSGTGNSPATEEPTETDLTSDYGQNDSRVATGGGGKKPNLLQRAWRWSKKHPKTSITLGLTAPYLTREYVVKPLLNYGAPIVGNAGSEIFAGKAPFSIPIVAGDSTDVLYKGSVGVIKGNSAPKIEVKRDTIREFTPVTTVNTIDIDSLLRATDPNLQR